MIFRSLLRAVFPSLLLAVAALPALAQTNPWTRVAPLPTAAGVQHITFGNGVFVGVCIDGEMVRSTDGLTWTSRPQVPNVRTLDDIAFGDGLFAAVGVCDDETAGIFTSPDGLKWTQRFAKNPNNSTLKSRLLTVSFGGSGFVAGGFASSVSGTGGFNETTLVSSSNGLSWARRPVSSFTHINAIAFGAGKYVAITSGAESWVSANGISWSKNEISLPGLSSIFPGDITFGEGQFVAVGSHSTGGLIMSSTNGTSWTQRTVPTTPTTFGFLQRVEYCNDRFLAFGSASFAGVFILSSPTGTAWTGFQLTNYPNAANVSGFAYGKDLFLAYGVRGNIYSSTNGTNFVRRAPEGNSGDLRDVAFGGGKFVAVGGRSDFSEFNVIQSSSNGTDWDTEKSGLTSSTSLTAVAYGNGRFVAVGGNNFQGRSGVATTSTNGSDWKGDTIGSGVTAMDTPNDLAYGAGLFAAVGPVGEVFTSPDGKNWVQRTTGITSTLMNIAWNGSRFVAVATDSQAITSTNGIDWTPIAIEGANNFATNRLAASDSGNFVYVASNGIFRSEKGTTWERVIDSSAPLAVSGSIVFANKQFVIAPAIILAAQERTFVSVNSGQTWSQSTNCPGGASAIAASSNLFVAVSFTGQIWTSKFSTPPAAPPVITSADLAVGTFGKAFSYQIKSTPAGSSYQALGLPAGLKINTTTGLISGTPQAAGTVQVNVQSTKANQTGQKLVTFQIAKATQTLRIPGIASRNFSTQSFAVSASASSELPVTVARVSGPIKVSSGRGGASISMTGLGTARVSFTQAGNANYEAVTRSVTFKIYDKIDPKLTFKKPTSSTTKSSLKITGSAKDNFTVGKLEIRVDGGSVKKVSLKSKPGGSVSWDYTVKLTRGSNKISVVLIDTAGNESKAESYTVTLR